MSEEGNKPIISTMINTAALALTSFGVLQITTSTNIAYGYLALAAGFGLEWFKYWGMTKKLW